MLAQFPSSFSSLLTDAHQQWKALHQREHLPVRGAVEALHELFLSQFVIYVVALGSHHRAAARAPLRDHQRRTKGAWI
jgi:hypothetical protein